MPTISWSGYSPTMGSNGGANPSVAGQLVDGESNLTRKVAQLLRRTQLRGVRRLLRVLNGNNVGAGGNAVENRGQVTAVQAIPDYARLGGQVAIASVPLVGSTTAGRVTATADQTRVNAMIDESNAPASYPSDLSGNGGGNKLNR